MNDPNNVNFKYTYLYKVDDAHTIGSGIKKTYQYASRVPIEALKKKREEFWGKTLYDHRDMCTRIERDLESTQVRLRE